MQQHLKQIKILKNVAIFIFFHRTSLVFEDANKYNDNQGSLVSIIASIVTQPFDNIL